ncbi:hypothetical protein FN846DRAFT_917011 [Sphaerosporella brunnea]|uniref:Uncharacterized protein n=1 Tax=Sphaerosporella brunnea TaxID=1250544 RepID=A0A5J5F5M3_9PEZI|nr:hypothetical protein FN846DRAFT_917011 [Sphaerosporella brunnea]
MRGRPHQFGLPKLNEQYQDKEIRLNKWKNSNEWKELRERELQEAREIRAAAIAKGEKPPKTTQTWRGKKRKIVKIERGKRHGIDSWRYIQHVCRPILWPECQRLAAKNPDFILMEDEIWKGGNVEARIQTRRGSERITTVKDMKRVLREDKITIEEINTEVVKLTTIMQRCINFNGGNKCHV